MLAERKTHRPEWIFLAALILINMAAKGAFLGINTGEYTDGVLQLTVFSNKAGLYPPLYGALAHGVSFAGLSLEAAGRVISFIAAALCVVPVYWMGRRLGGPGAARLAGLLYTVSPMPWRWSVRVMTDSLYLLLSTVTMVLLVEACLRMRPGHSDQAQARPNNISDEMTERRFAGRCLAGAVAAAGFAALTRYQGVLFAPLLLVPMVMYVRRYRRAPRLSFLAGAIWLALPAWMAWNGFAHQGQFSSRTAPTPLATATAWWNTLESFVLISPYYLGYPLVAAAVAGLFYKRWAATANDSSSESGRNAQPAFALWLWGGYAVLLLGLHATFGSFQYRYMMPLLPIIVALAAVGFVWLEHIVANRRWIYSLALMASVIYLAVFSLAVLVLQREAFGDQREAAEFIRAQVPMDTPVYANERYGSFTDLGSVKFSFWSGRRVSTILSADQPLEAGAVLALGTAYGGDEAVGAMMQALSERYTLQPLTPQPFRSQLTPLMDDIMTNPMFNQNPLAWVMRYVPQHFATQLFVVQPKTSVMVADGSAYGA